MMLSILTRENEHRKNVIPSVRGEHSLPPDGEAWYSASLVQFDCFLTHALLSLRR